MARLGGLWARLGGLWATTFGPLAGHRGEGGTGLKSGGDWPIAMAWFPKSTFQIFWENVKNGNLIDQENCQKWECYFFGKIFKKWEC